MPRKRGRLGCFGIESRGFGRAERGGCADFDEGIGGFGAKVADATFVRSGFSASDAPANLFQ